MATITQLQSGKWQAKIRLKGYSPVSKTFQTKTDADKWGKVVEAEMIRGTYVCRTESEQTSLGEALKRYLKEVSPRKKTEQFETYLIKRLMDHPLAKRSLASLTSNDLAKWRDVRLKEVKPASVARELGLIGAVLSQCTKEWRILQSSPLQNVRPPKFNNERSRRLSKDEEAYLMPELRGYMGPLVRLALETAMIHLSCLVCGGVFSKKEKQSLIDLPHN